MHFQSLSLKAKLIASSIVMAVIVSLVGIVDFFIINKVSQLYTHELDQNAKKVFLVMVMSLDVANLDTEIHGLKSHKTENEKSTILKNLAHYFEDCKKNAEVYQALLTQGSEDITAFNLIKNLEEYQEKYKKIVSYYETETKALEASEATLNAMFVDYEKVFLNFRATSQQIIEQENKNKESSLQYIDQIKNWSEIVSLSLIFMGIFLPIVLGFIFAKNISTILGHITTQLGSGMNLLRGISSEIAESSINLADSTSYQAAALQETMASINQMSAMITMNTENTLRSQSESENSSSSAQRGQEAVDFMIKSIQEIEESNRTIMLRIETSHQEMGDIVSVINEIAQKTKVINEIVFQTKLLSFNASVEAARAGEHGKGFAVVAEEVGNLAQMSGNAAKEITQLLDQSVEKVETIVKRTRTEVEQLMSLGSEKVVKSIDGVQRCREVLSEIVKSVTLLHSMLIDISKASEEQKIGVSEVEKAMEKLDEITQNNNSTAQKANRSSESLAVQADEIAAAVDELSSLLNANKKVSIQKIESKKDNQTQESGSIQSNVISIAPKLISKKEEVKKKAFVAAYSQERSSKPVNVKSENNNKHAHVNDENKVATQVKLTVNAEVPSGNQNEVPDRDDSRFEDV